MVAGVVRDLDGVQLLSVVAFADVVDACDVRTHVIHHLHQLNTNTTVVLIYIWKIMKNVLLNDNVNCSQALY